MAGFRAGTSLHAQLAPRWSVSSGLWLEWKSAGNVDYGSLTKLTHDTVKVPLLVHYQRTDKRLTPYFSAGLLLEKLMYFQHSNPKPSENIVLIDLAIEPQLKYLVGAGARYRFNEHLAGIIQPTFVFGARASEQTYQLSLQTQLVCRF
ncbi:hypothetical protein GBK04_27725 [Cytophagaceae bacterium SJW1-29]|uniref:Outer membrane beta-barrel protein n=2 Tax=Salmonirosea aquatica TaxID=2654236 RepID=A0A7C9BED7_9BACT|nr:hypothetical protein [Cytophagaceae bacterium SJW1-29]